MEGKEKGDMKKVLVVGSLNMDMVLSVDHHPVPGETIIGDGITYHPGGKGANQAYAVGKLGGDVRIIGCVGWDNNGMILTENLAQAGVDTTAINRMPEAPTGMAIIDVDKKGDNSIIVISWSQCMPDTGSASQTKGVCGMERFYYDTVGDAN